MWPVATLSSTQPHTVEESGGPVWSCIRPIKSVRVNVESVASPSHNKRDTGRLRLDGGPHMSLTGFPGPKHHVRAYSVTELGRRLICRQ